MNGLGIWLLLATLAVIAVVIVIVALLMAAYGYTPKPSHGGSQFSRGLLTGSARGPGYYPTGMFAVTPSGVRVRAGCPHLGGHATPGQAVTCGQQQKARIERTGR